MNIEELGFCSLGVASEDTSGVASGFASDDDAWPAPPFVADDAVGAGVDAVGAFAGVGAAGAGDGTGAAGRVAFAGVLACTGCIGA